MKGFLIGLALATIAFFPGYIQADQQPCSMKVKNLKQPKQGLNPNSKVTIEMELETVNCVIRVNLTGSGGRAPALLWMKPSPGLEGKGTLSYADFDKVTYGAPEANAHAVKATVTLEASPEIALGHRNIEALLTYNAVDQTGSPVEGHFAFEIPMEVTAPKPPSYWEKHARMKKSLVTTGLVVLAIPLLPVWFILSALGVVQGL